MPNSTSEPSNRWLVLLLWGVVLGLLTLAYHFNFLLLHTVIEIFAVVVACGIFMIAWNTRRHVDNNFFLFLGIAYLFVGAIDLLHALTYKGMAILPGLDADPPTQLWIAARYLQSVSIVLALLFIKKRTKPASLFLAYGVVTAAIVVSIFAWPIFPSCFVEGSGLTPFKKTSEYVICGILAGGLLLLLLRRKEFHPDVVKLLAGSIILLIFAELAFTFYLSVYDIINFTGHLFKLVAFYLLYKVMIATCLSRPFDLLFLSLKESERAVKKDRDFISAILDTADALLLVLDADGAILRANHACEVITGYSAAEMQEKKIVEFVPVEDRAFFAACIEKPRQGEDKPSGCEVPLIAKSGDRILIAWSGTSFAPGEGSPGHLILTGIDITSRKKAEEQIEILNTDLAARAAELEAANRELETFSHSVSHDLRRPLTNINGYCQVILHLFADQTGPEPVKYVREIYDETLKMNRLIETLLDFSQVAKGAPRRHLLDLSAMVRKVGDELQHSAPGRRVSLTIEEGLWAQGDPDLVRIVLENLLGNAWKYTGKREEAVIRFFQCESDGEKVFAVSDNGAGFDNSKADRLFLPFQRLHRDFEGHGIGLATVQRIIHRHGGKIWAEGEPDRGATFFFTLPS